MLLAFTVLAAERHHDLPVWDVQRVLNAPPVVASTSGRHRRDFFATHGASSNTTLKYDLKLNPDIINLDEIQFAEYKCTGYGKASLVLLKHRVSLFNVKQGSIVLSTQPSLSCGIFTDLARGSTAPRPMRVKAIEKGDDSTVVDIVYTKGSLLDVIADGRFHFQHHPPANATAFSVSNPHADKSHAPRDRNLFINYEVPKFDKTIFQKGYNWDFTKNKVTQDSIKFLEHQGGYIACEDCYAMATAGMTFSLEIKSGSLKGRSSQGSSHPAY